MHWIAVCISLAFLIGFLIGRAFGLQRASEVQHRIAAAGDIIGSWSRDRQMQDAEAEARVVAIEAATRLKSRWENLWPEMNSYMKSPPATEAALDEIFVNLDAPPTRELVKFGTDEISGARRHQKYDWCDDEETK